MFIFLGLKMCFSYKCVVQYLNWVRFLCSWKLFEPCQLLRFSFTDQCLVFKIYASCWHGQNQGNVLINSFFKNALSYMESGPRLHSLQIPSSKYQVEPRALNVEMMYKYRLDLESTNHIQFGLFYFYQFFFFLLFLKMLLPPFFSPFKKIMSL